MEDRGRHHCHKGQGGNQTCDHWEKRPQSRRYGSSVWFYWSVDRGEPLGLSTQVLRHCLSQTGPGLLWIFGGFTMSRAVSPCRPQSGDWLFELMLHILGLLSGPMQFLLRAVLSQILWFPLPWRSCSCFLILSIEHRTESLTLSGLAYFPHCIDFLQKLCSIIYGPQLGVS
jgi:hypothetical protein